MYEINELEEFMHERYMVVARKEKRAIYIGLPFYIMSVHSSKEECITAYQEAKKKFPDAEIRWKPAWFIVSPADYQW